jgi:malate dehydrogenase (oxaloacetate-decarboxylating)
MAKESPHLNIEELLAKAEKPSAEAMRLHPFYQGKVEVAVKARVRDFNDFAIWYTPGVAAPCKAIEADPDLVYEHTHKWNTVAIVSDGTRVLGLGNPDLAESIWRTSPSRNVFASSTPCVPVQRFPFGTTINKARQPSL